MKKFQKCAIVSRQLIRQDIIDDIDGREEDFDECVDANPIPFYSIKVLSTRGKDINETTRIRMDELRNQIKKQGFKYFLLTKV